MDQAITLQDQAMTAEAEQQGVPRMNPPANTMDSRLRDFTRMNPYLYTGSKIVEDLEEEFRESMLHDNMDLSRLMVYVQQVEESRKNKHTRVGNMSRQAEENFSRKSSTEIRDKPRAHKEVLQEVEEGKQKQKETKEDGNENCLATVTTKDLVTVLDADMRNIACDESRWVMGTSAASHTKTLGGALYFVNFIDDFLIKHWVYVSKTTDQVLGVFKQFQASAQRETGKKLKCIHTNNGGEYCGPFDEYCKYQGIRHQKTPPKAPQLNGLAERMNKIFWQSCGIHFGVRLY
nr:uncharacterized protein LOC104644677 [Solanum lycopersicum]